ncbi:MAG: YkgJ family cysteine cluster protein [Ginsengibacter sp.]
METTHLKRLKKNFDRNRKSFRYFITRVENNPPVNLDNLMETVEKEVWQEVSCLSCANCCKMMSPTYTFADIKRISTHLGMRPKDFKEKWLYREKKKNDWMNRSQPCQFLDLKTNMCSIYEVRPADCADFPHFHRRPATDYFYIHKQNIEYCPATMLLVEKLKERVNSQFHLPDHP